MQTKQVEWKDQWSRFKNDTVFLFQDWIFPYKLTDFKGKRVLDAGCGRGHHSLIVAPYAKEVVGVDLNAHEIARQATQEHENITIHDGDISLIQFDQPFDVVYCIGVIHHTDNPTKTFQHLKSLTIKGGKLIVWCYSHEGNFWNRTLVEGIKKWGLANMPRGFVVFLSHLLTTLLYPIVHTIYRFPFARFFPYDEYFINFRKLSYNRNLVNVFDKLNAPQTFFIKRKQTEEWFNPSDFDDIHISPYMGVSWRCSGIKK